ncbi:7tm Odorant receptor [Popillia japonica]|uniref:Odorant receptor n=1 Tax=Popillia japonica TaxID=7064 RepID=A0AAW1NJP4_POPJA
MEAFVLFSQYYFFLIYVPVVYAFDNFYIAYSIHVILQLRLLKYSFEQIKHEDESGLIHQCVRQHKLLLGRMRSVYFWMLLFHYAVTLITGCSHLYIILLAQPGLFEMIASTIYLAALIVEFGVYTISVEEIVYQLTDISRSIYMSTWYERNLSDKRDLLMIMMKTQRQKYLSAAGMIDMNVDTFGSALLKYVCFIYYKSDIEKMLDDLQEFWKITEVPEIDKVTKIVYKYLFLGQKMYMLAGFTVLCIYDLRPLLEKQTRFMFECWPLLNNSIIVESIVLFSQYYFFLISLSVVYAFDNFYIAYSIHLIMQLKLLRYTFENIRDEDESERIHQCIRQHKLLLAQPGLFEMTASTIYFAAIIGEFAYYTISVEEIVYQLTDISRSIYMSRWYERNLSDKRDLLIIMMKTQRQKYLSAAGIIDMSVDTFGSVSFNVLIWLKFNVKKFPSRLPFPQDVFALPPIEKYP